MKIKKTSFLKNEHQLRHQKAQGPYKCHGCKQPGFATCFRCPKDICDFYLHEDCFQAEHSPYKTHKFVEKCKFYYHTSPSGVANKYCNACGLDILGFSWKLRDKVESKCLHCDQRYPAEKCVGFTGGGNGYPKRDIMGFPFVFQAGKFAFM